MSDTDHELDDEQIHVESDDEMEPTVVRLPIVREIPATRPTLRSECVDGFRPCPWVSCREHAVSVLLTGENATTMTDEQVLELLDAMPWSCTLDVIDLGGVTRDQIATVLGITRQRVGQIEEKALETSRKRAWRVGLTSDVLDDVPDMLDAARSRRESKLVGAARPVLPKFVPPPPPPHLAHLPGPATVEPNGTFWCAPMGVAVDTALCTGRHTARRHDYGNVYTPIYRDCAACPEGASLVTRIGVRPRSAMRRLPLLATAPTLNRSEAHETTMNEATNPATELPAAEPQLCMVRDCANHVGPVRKNTLSGTEGLCVEHRRRLRDRQSKSDQTFEVALARMMGNTVPERHTLPSTITEPETHAPFSCAPPMRATTVPTRASDDPGDVLFEALKDFRGGQITEARVREIVAEEIERCARSIVREELAAAFLKLRGRAGDR